MGNAPEQELAQVARAAKEALTDSMVERLTGMAGGLIELLDKLNEPDTKDAVMSALDRLTDMHRVGALETLFSMVEGIHAARMAMNDTMVDRLFGFMEHMLNNLGTEEVATLAHNTRRAMEEAIDDVADKPHPGGLLATLSMLSKPETQHAIHLMLTFASKWQKRAFDQRFAPPQ